MGTVSNLPERPRRPEPASGALTMTPYGFAAGDTVVAWQGVSAIRAWKVDPAATGTLILEFVGAGPSVVISAEQAGFAALDAAMCSVFPCTAGWRERLPMSAPRQKTVLFQRG